MSFQNRGLAELITDYLSSCTARPNFPLGGDEAIPSDAERSLLQNLGNLGIPDESELITLRKSIDRRAGSRLAILAVRTAVLAVRTKSPDLLELSCLFVVVDDQVDFRDILCCLAIIEECARRLNVDFPATIRRYSPLAGSERRSTIEADYLAREESARDLAIFGFVAKETKAGVTFARNLVW